MDATEQTPTGGEGEGTAPAPSPVAQELETNAGTLLTSAESNEGKQQAEPQEGGNGEAGEAGAEGQAEGEEGAEKEEGEGEKQGAPEKYEDFKMPEGTELDAEVSTAFQGVAKELNLSQDQAQGFLDKMAPCFRSARPNVSQRSRTSGWNSRKPTRSSAARSSRSRSLTSLACATPSRVTLTERSMRTFRSPTLPDGKPPGRFATAEPHRQAFWRGEVPRWRICRRRTIYRRAVLSRRNERSK